MSILIVGLGNPGPEYEKTRHNAGFIALDALAERWGTSWRRDTGSRSLISETNRFGQKIILAKPMTFMNNSGQAVTSLCGKYKIEAQNVWAVYDDVALTEDQVRVRRGGSAGGHNGVKSLIEHAGDPFARFRIGVGAPPERVPLEDYVLQPFGKDGLALMKKKSLVVAELIEKSLTDGVTESTFPIV